MSEERHKRIRERAREKQPKFSLGSIIPGPLSHHGTSNGSNMTSINLL